MRRDFRTTRRGCNIVVFRTVRNEPIIIAGRDKFHCGVACTILPRTVQYGKLPPDRGRGVVADVFVYSKYSLFLSPLTVS